MFRRRRRSSALAPAPALGPRWRPYAEHADRAAARFAELVASVPRGPLQERMLDVVARFERDVITYRDVLSDADRLERIAATLDVGAITDAYKRARRERDALAARGSSTDALDASVAALGEQHARAHALLNRVDDAEATLAALRVRLDTALVVAADIVAGAAMAPERLAGLERDLGDLGDELEGLRRGLAELG